MQKQTKPILLFDGGCGVCRHIAHWVQKSAQSKLGETSIIVRPVGDDPEDLHLLNPNLNIWDAYATIHLLMPDGSMKLGGEAVAKILQTLPNTKWFAWSFAINTFGFRPFQTILNLAYIVLDDVRPLFGCESCGTPSFWVRPFAGLIKWAKAIFGENRHASRTPHSTAFSAKERRPLPVLGERPPQAEKRLA
jgi:predicted DCC family thiol-disulfide oxidoreductase YuxK